MRRGAGAGRFGCGLERDLHVGIVDRRFQLPADFFLRVAGEDAAVDVGRGALGQRVGRVPGGELRCDAGGVEGARCSSGFCIRRRMAVAFSPSAASFMSWPSWPGVSSPMRLKKPVVASLNSMGNSIG